MHAVEIRLSLRCAGPSLACRTNVSLTGLAAGVAHHAEPLYTGPGKFLVEKTDAELLFLSKTWPPWIFTSVLVIRTFPPRFEHEGGSLLQKFLVSVSLPEIFHTAG